jgi:hypothetical protein
VCLFTGLQVAQVRWTVGSVVPIGSGVRCAPRSQVTVEVGEGTREVHVSRDERSTLNFV